MSQFDNCTNCFRPLNGNVFCTQCGHSRTKEKPYAGVLPAFVVLNNRYLVGRVLGKGGFGITYNAMDMVTNQICAIKEYMPSEYSTRSNGTTQVIPFSDKKSQYVFNHGKEKFVEEARTLLKLKNDPIVVDILDYFNQNNTAYLVMEYLDGQDLRKMARSSGGKLDAEFMKMVFVTVASSLMEIHRKNILHRDLSPENIIVTTNGSIKLIDFGAARNFVSTQNVGMSILLKPGFAPPEQYEKMGTHGPWSDVYALCATFYNLVSGKPLVDALFRYRGEVQPSLASLGCPVTKKTSDVIEKGMELDYKKRYKDFKALMDDIDIVVSPAVKKTTPPSVKPPVQPVQPIKSVQPVQSVTSIPKNVRPYVAAMVGGGIRNKIMIGSDSAFRIGRSAQNCQYIITGDTNISRVHCQLRVAGSEIFITDLSANGTFLGNGVRLEKNREYKINIGTQFYLATPNHMMTIGE